MTFFANIFNRNAKKTAPANTNSKAATNYKLKHMVDANKIRERAERDRQNGEQMKNGNFVKGAGNVSESYINDAGTLWNAMNAERNPRTRNAFRSLYAACKAYVLKGGDHNKQAIFNAMNTLGSMHVHVSKEAINGFVIAFRNKDIGRGTQPIEKKQAKRTASTRKQIASTGSKKQKQQPARRTTSPAPRKQQQKVQVKPQIKKLPAKPAAPKHVRWTDGFDNKHNDACGLVHFLLKIGALQAIGEEIPNLIGIVYTEREFDSLTEKTATLLAEIMNIKPGKSINVAKLVHVARKCTCQNCSVKKYEEDTEVVDLIAPALDYVEGFVK